MIGLTCFLQLLPKFVINPACLFQKTLIYDPTQRISAKEALQHPYFDDLDKSTLPAKNWDEQHICCSQPYVLMWWHLAVLNQLCKVLVRSFFFTTFLHIQYTYTLACTINFLVCFSKLVSCVPVIWFGWFTRGCWHSDLEPSLQVAQTSWTHSNYHVFGSSLMGGHSP